MIKIEEAKYLKMRCNAGHETRPYAKGEKIPKRCPVCNQPYDRRYNRPIYCCQDGSVPEENGSAEEKHSDNLVEKVDKESQVKKSIESVKSTQNNSSRRGRSLVVNDIHSINTERGRKYSIINEQVTNTDGQVKINDTFENNTKIGLFNGGDCIALSKEGGFLGREEQGQEFLKMYPLISRKHAYVQIDPNGTIQVRDEGSLNGTYIDNGKGRIKLKPHETVNLKIGDTIWLANYVLAIEEIKC